MLDARRSRFNEDVLLNIYVAEWFAKSGYFTIDEALEEMRVPGISRHFLQKRLNLMSQKIIFDYNPTKEELKELFAFNEDDNTMCWGFSIIPSPVSAYSEKTSYEEKMLDLAILFELRGQQDEADKIWAQIPDVAVQYRCGFDDQAIPM